MARQKKYRVRGIHPGPGTAMDEIRKPLKNILTIISNTWMKIKAFPWFFGEKNFL
jgi:hypothetical protein